MRYKQLLSALVLCLIFGFGVTTSWAARVKDLTTVQGVRDNQLVGYGLVVGLDGTGDQTTQTPFTTQSLMSMLSQLGINVPPGTRLQLKNVAAVMVTATLPAFSQPGQGLDVTVSSMGNAKSLSGGTLLLTPLKGADGQVYAMAQGNLVVGGAGASAGGSRTQINHLSAGRIPNGATVERDVASAFAEQDVLQLELKNADFSMASAIVEAINKRFPGAARAKDARVITLNAPQSSDNKVTFLARVQEVNVAQSVAPAKIIVNARTGSVVMNQAVSIGSVAVSHGNLSVTINATPNVSQPNALSPGQTVVTEQTDIKVEQQGGELIDLPSSANLADVVKALNRLGATPQDLISILQAMQSAGALQADLEII